MKLLTSTTKMMTMAMVAMMAFTFTACEEHWYEDDWGWRGNYWEDPYDRGSDYLINLARTLRGKWEGDLMIRATDDYGKEYTTYYVTQFEFDQYSADTTNGRGVEVDYLDGNEEYYDTFSWYIDDKTEDIYLRFDSNGRTMRMDSYHVDKDRFYGSMYSQKTGEYNEFDLTRYTYANDSGNLFEADGETATVKKETTETVHPKGLGGHK